MFGFFKKQSPARIISLGFAIAILIGSLLLMLPISVREGVKLQYIDALYTSTSAVCVTGLVVVDSVSTFTPIGQTILGLLIQIGGLGVTSMGAGVILALGRKINMRGRNLIRQGANLDSVRGTIRFIRSVFLTTMAIELVGAIASFLSFRKDFPFLRAIGVSIFHSVATFNNSGFDLVGNFQSLIPYRDDVWLNMVTAVLIFLGGIGFLVIREVREKKLKWKRYSMHTKIVLSVSFVLIVIGTILLKLTEKISWLGAFFQSVSTRTAGFATYSLDSFTAAGLLVMIVLMVIGASPGSTGGGIKTSTFFTLIIGVRSAATNTSEKAFKYAVPRGSFRKACAITLLALTVVIGGTYLMQVMEPGLPFIEVLFEVASAFGTAGLSTGITQTLSTGSKLLTIILMYIGRLGPLTIATLWYFTNKGERVEHPEGNIAIG